VKLNTAAIRYWVNLTLGRSQPANDSHRRYARLLQSALTALAGRGVAIIVSIIAVPLTVGYLGVERYGVWIAISTFLVWLTVADLGLGNGLVNALSEAYGQDRPELAQHYVATTFWMLVVVALALAGLMVLAWPWLKWTAWLNVQSPQARAEVAPAVATAMAIFLLNFPLSVVTRILMAYQEGMLANYWAAAGNIISLMGILIVTQMQGGLPWLVVGFSGAQLLVTAVSAIWLFGRHKPWLRPSPSAFDRQHWRRLFQTGVDFFFLQIVTLILFQSDNLVIAHFLGPEHVTGYSIVYRLFSYISMVQSLLLGPLWPAYGEAATRNDWAWIVKALRRSLGVSMVCFALLVVGLAVIAQPLIAFWMGGKIAVSDTLVWLVAVWTIMSIWGNNFAFIQNGLGHIRIQTIVGICMAILNLALSIVWIQRIGVLGVISATIVAYGLTSFWTAPTDTFFVLRDRLNKGSRQSALR